MELKILGSGSKGNSYLLKPKEGKSLLIECGLTWKKTKKELDYDLNIAGCIATHEHFDHIKCYNDVMKAGIPFYCSYGTATALKLISNHNLKERDKVNIGDFIVLVFGVDHDAAQPLGFIINHPECGNIVFATDTKSLNHKFGNINHWIIEANYSETIMMEELEEEQLSGHLANRIYDNHMSLETCINVLKENELFQTRTITLIHLSSKNAWGDMFIDMVSRMVGIKPYIAEKGLIVNLDL